MSVAVPTLSANGWVTGITAKADALLAYYFTSLHSQSLLYRQQITSLTYHVQRHNGDPIGLKNAIDQDIKQYLGKYFDTVTSDIRVDDGAPENPGQLTIHFEVTVSQGGTRYQMGREVQLANNQVARIMNNQSGEEILIR